MDAPLHTAIQGLTQGVSLKDLQEAYATLSHRYRTHEKGHAFMRTPMERLAYLLVRMPATYAACDGALSHLPDPFFPQTSLDLGAGFGALTWALRNRFPGMSAHTLVERDGETLHLGEKLNLPHSTWIQGDLGNARSDTYDLVGASYALSETPPEKHGVIIDHMWQATKQILILVEPGTPQGFAVIKAARTHLLSQGGHILAPCTHSESCPMTGGNWCHFSASLPRTFTHQYLKQGSLGNEVEKYSYLIVSKTPVPRIPNQGRVLGHPLKKTGHLLVDVCSESGFQRHTFSKRQGDAYKMAKELQWGDRLIFPPIS